MGSGVVYLNTYGLGPLRVVPTTATQPVDPSLKRGIPRQFQQKKDQFNSPHLAAAASAGPPAAAAAVDALSATASRALSK